MAHDVFISYAEEDKSTANAACTALESEGISCWIAPRDIRPGAKWEQAIMDAISASRVMVLVFSEHANRSEHVQREVGTAFDNGITVIPFRLSNTKPTGILEYYLRPVQWLDAFTQPLESHFKSLAVQVGDLLSESEAVVADSSVMKVFRDNEYHLIISFQGPKFAVGGKLTARLDLGHTKGLLGPSTNPSEQRGFHNEENTLFGINHQPCTKASCVYFFVFANENFVVIKDVNARVARFLDEPSELGFLRIQSINGTAARLQTIDFRERPPYREKELLVNVDGDGRITFIPEKNPPQKAP
ncbi:MAG: toll/interleukin-1 receptor domain-containing protein [Chthoniobacterales bacterium]